MSDAKRAGGPKRLTLKAAGLLDVDAGAIIRPGIVAVEDDRIVGIGGDGVDPAAPVIDLGDAVLLPGLMDMEVNLLMGGKGENPVLSQVQDDPATRVANWPSMPGRPAQNARTVSRYRPFHSLQVSGNSPTE